MIVQFFRYGKGMSKGPLDYLLGKDRDRDHARLLSGSEQEVAGLIDSSPFAKKYTAGCLSFYENDLDPVAKEKIMADFEKCLFPGLDQSQYRVLWIEHKDKLNERTGEKRLELNFLIPNVEILTGQRLQPYYDRADRPRIDLFKKITTYDYRLHDADDPIHRQAVTTAKSLPKSVAGLKETLDIEVTKAIEAGLVKDRETMKKWFAELGLEITRETKKSISIKNPSGDENARPIRLTGAIYEQDFRLTAESAELTRDASERYRKGAEQRHQENLQRYASYCAKRSADFEQRYRQHKSAYRAEAERSSERDITADRPDYSSNQEAAATRHDSSIARTTTADQTAKSELAAVERLEPSNSRTSEAEKSPFFIEYSLGFDSTYFSYFEHLSRLRQQEQIQRHHRDGKKSPMAKKPRGEYEYSEVWNREKMELVRPNRPESAAVQQQYANSAGNQLNDSRSTIIEDHRRTARSIEATTARSIESTATYSTAVSDYRAVKTIHDNFKREAQRSSGDREEISADRAKSIRADYFTKFFGKTERELELSFANTFERVSDDFESRFRSSSTDHQKTTEFSASGDRETAHTVGTTDENKVRFSEQVSRRIQGLNPSSIFSALDQLDQRRELQRAQERKNDRGYDSPSF